MQSHSHAVTQAASMAPPTAPRHRYATLHDSGDGIHSSRHSREGAHSGTGGFREGVQAQVDFGDDT